MRTQQAVLKIIVMVLALAVPASSAQAFWLRIPKELLGAREARGQEIGPQMGQPGGMTSGPQMGQPDMRGPGDHQGPSAEDMARRQEEEMTRRQQQDGERGLEDMKRGVQSMAMGIKNLEFMFKQLEKQGVAIPAEIKDKLARVKAIIEAVKAAKTTEEFQAAGFDEIGEHFAALEEYRRDVAENEMRMRGVRQGIKGMEQGLKMFERQIAALKKQKVEIPASVTETLDKIKAIVAIVKTAKTWEEVEAAGIEDLPELMQSLNELRQELEQLVRFPQTLKHLDRELTRLNQELKRAKRIVDSLSKKGIDLAMTYSEFEAAVNKLKEVRAKAVDLVKSGQAEEAFDLLEQEFFGQMQDVWEHHRIIMTMSNLGRFTSEFKRGIADAQRTIRQLKARKVDVSELEDLLAQAKAKGEEITALMKAKPPEIDTIMEGLQELENIKQAFEEKARELRGEEVLLPWEQGPAVFKSAPVLPADWEKFVPKKETPAAPVPTESSNATTPAQLTPTSTP